MGRQILYTPEQIEFIAANAVGRSRAELISMFNKRFNTQKNYKQISCVMEKNNLRSNFKGLFTPEHIAFLTDNVKGCPRRELMARFNEQFNTDMSFAQISQALYGRGLCNGLRGRCSTGWFKKGHQQGKRERKNDARSSSQKPIGSERIRKDDCTLVKISEPDKWVRKHIFIWEYANGSIPKSHVVIFADGNKNNFDPDNLIAISRKHHVIMNTHHLFSSDPNLTRLGITLADVIIKTNDLRRQQKENKSRKEAIL